MPVRAQKLAEREGMHVRLLDMHELCEKAGGASRCLVCHVKNAHHDIQVPPEHRLERTRDEIQAE